jgi:hypothetical protein
MAMALQDSRARRLVAVTSHWRGEGAVRLIKAS